MRWCPRGDNGYHVAKSTRGQDALAAVKEAHCNRETYPDVDSPIQSSTCTAIRTCRPTESHPHTFSTQYMHERRPLWRVLATAVANSVAQHGIVVRSSKIGNSNPDADHSDEVGYLCQLSSHWRKTLHKHVQGTYVCQRMLKARMYRHMQSSTERRRQLRNIFGDRAVSSVRTLPGRCLPPSSP